MKSSILLTKSKAFALRVVRLYKYLRERKESVIAKQMLRAGTSIGANIAESRYAQSKTDFASKLQIALKEAAETEYWLELLRAVQKRREAHRGPGNSPLQDYKEYVIMRATSN